MAQKLAFVNNKGGSAKTTTVVNLAGALHVRYPSKKILIFEVDGQGNASRSFGINSNDFDQAAEDIFLGNISANHAIVKNVAPNIDLIPGNEDLNFLEFDQMQEAEDDLPRITKQIVNTLKKQFIDKILNANQLSRNDLVNLVNLTFSDKNVDSLVKKAQFFPSKNYFTMLNKKIDELDKEYDYIFFDTPPEIKAVTSSVLAVSDKVIIPYEPDSFSIDGVQNIIKRIKVVKDEYNPKLEIGGLLAVKYRKPVTLHNNTVLALNDFANTHGIPFFSTRIPFTIAFTNSITLYKKPATLADHIGKQKKVFVEYFFKLLDEMIEKNVINV